MRLHPLHEVLLVDPDDEVRASRTLFLRMHGIRTMPARAFDDTLQLLRAGFRPCVVLADSRAERDAGWLTVDRLRADSVLATVPMVLITRDPMQAKCAHWYGIRECLDGATGPVRFVGAIERHCRRPRRPPRSVRELAPWDLIAPPPQLRRPA